MIRKSIGVFLAFLSIPVLVDGRDAAQDLPRRDWVRLDKMSTALQKLARYASPAVVQVVTRGF